ncbi:MAG: hypothetical protein GY757_58405 [bacterium]|nr:hypothetical protein [bacterium]
MSETYRIVMVPVNAVEEETVRLADILGHIPTQEVCEVLNSQWARQKGWQTVKKDQTYMLRLPGKLKMQIKIEENGQVNLKRFAQSNVRTEDRRREKNRLEQLIKNEGRQYNLAFNEVLGRALAKSLSNRAKETGYEVVEEHQNTQGHVIDMELKMNVYEMA